MIMHKTNPITDEKKRIQELRDELKYLELKQEEQALQEKVDDKSFWTKHKNLRNTMSSIRSGAQAYGKTFRKDVLPAMRSTSRQMLKSLQTTKAEERRIKKEEREMRNLTY